jgi:hypothetical protein
MGAGLEYYVCLGAGAEAYASVGPVIMWRHRGTFRYSFLLLDKNVVINTGVIQPRRIFLVL